MKISGIGLILSMAFIANANWSISRINSSTSYKDATLNQDSERDYVEHSDYCTELYSFAEENSTTGSESYDLSLREHEVSSDSRPLSMGIDVCAMGNRSFGLGSSAGVIITGKVSVGIARLLRSSVFQKIIIRKQ
jgi:hypothetical protein